MQNRRWCWLATAAQFRQMMDTDEGRLLADVFQEVFGEQDVVMRVSRDSSTNAMRIRRCRIATAWERAGRSRAKDLIDIRRNAEAAAFYRLIRRIEETAKRKRAGRCAPRSIDGQY